MTSRYDLRQLHGSPGTWAYWTSKPSADVWELRVTCCHWIDVSATFPHGQAGDPAPSLLPHVGDGCCGCGPTQAWQPVHVFDRTQHVVMVDLFTVLPGLDHGSHKDRDDVIAGSAIILIELHDQKTVVVLRPRYIGHQIGLQPAVSLLDVPIVHVIVQVRNHPGDGWQLGKIGWEVGERLVVAGEVSGEVRPRSVLARIFSVGANLGAHPGQPLRITRESLARREQHALQRSPRKCMRTGIVDNPVRRSREKSQIIRLARMRKRERIREQCALRGERVYIRSLAGPDNLRVTVVLLYHDNHVSRRGNSSRNGGNLVDCRLPIDA